MKYLVALAAGAALTACEPVIVPTGEVVPFSQVLAETKDRPFECIDYDPATDSCEAIGTTVRRGLVFISDMQVAVSAAPLVIATVRARARSDKQGRLCTTGQDLSVNVDGMSDPNASRFIQDVMRAEIDRVGGVCVIYTRAGDDYVLVSVSTDGRVLPDGPSRTTFFAAPKALRSAN